MPPNFQHVWSAPVGVAYLVVGAALTSSRLLSVLHAESSAVVACAAFFLSGLHVLGRRNAISPDVRVLCAHLCYLLIPWLILTVSLLWVPNCAYGTGLVLYGAYTVPSVILGFGLATAILAFVGRYRRTVFVLSGLSIAVLGTLYDLALHPQFYVLNHVYGGILGPIYEQALFIRPGLFAFRALTLLWALLLLAVAARRRTGEARRSLLIQQRGIIVGVTAICIGLIYLFAPALGINTPSWYIHRTLGGKLETEHFDLYFSPHTFEEADLQAAADEHEYRYDWLRERLGTSPDERIRSYLYPTVSEKLQLTGAGLTDVSPVWLRHPQMHMMQSSYRETLGHEMVHVFSREFGLPVIRASWLIGLVEGLAVALEPPDGRPSVREQMAVAAQRSQNADVGIETSLAPALVRMMSAASFWSARGAVSYTTAGSFVAYLIDQYGAERIRDVYALGDFRDEYGKSLPHLAAEWESYIRRTPLVSIAADDHVMRRFTLPSLFEVDCPHYRPQHVAAYHESVDLLAVGDTSGAKTRLATSLRREPQFVPSLTLWSVLQLRVGAYQEVVDRLQSLPDSLFTAPLHVYYGDALALGADSVNAMRAYEAALGALPLDARDVRAMVLARRLGNGSASVAASFHGLVTLPADGPASDLAPAPRIAAALRAAAAGRFDEAAELVEGVSIPDSESSNAAERELMVRMTTAWAGIWSRRSGDPAAATRYLRRARTSAAQVGDLAHVAELSDQLEKTYWLFRPSSNVALALFNIPRVSERPLQRIPMSHVEEVACR